jgi:6-pyruvoyltetrahydropterin/6-carboxytetrahydropterin synthase
MPRVANMSAPVVEIVHRLEFSASHRLHAAGLSDEENANLYGPCNNPRGHGHNYVLEVAVRGGVSPETGMVMNLVDLAEILRIRLFEHVDHKHLNHDVPFLEGINPTAENIAVAFWNELESELESYAPCRLHRIRLYESRANFVDYYGPATSTPPN